MLVRQQLNWQRQKKGVIPTSTMAERPSDSRMMRFTRLSCSSISSLQIRKMQVLNLPHCLRNGCSCENRNCRHSSVMLTLQELMLLRMLLCARIEAAPGIRDLEGANGRQHVSVVHPVIEPLGRLAHLPQLLIYCLQSGMGKDGLEVCWHAATGRSCALHHLFVQRMRAEDSSRATEREWHVRQ